MRAFLRLWIVDGGLFAWACVKRALFNNWWLSVINAVSLPSSVLLAWILVWHPDWTKQREALAGFLFVAVIPIGSAVVVSLWRLSISPFLVFKDAERAAIGREIALAGERDELRATLSATKGLKVSVVNFSLYADATIAVQLIFLNDGPTQRKVLSVALESRASNQALEESGQFRMAFDRVDGDSRAPITVNPNSEAAPKYKGIVPSNLLKEVGATIGLDINASDGKGACSTTHLKLLTINPAPTSGGISYTPKPVINVPLNESN